MLTTSKCLLVSEEIKGFILPVFALVVPVLIVFVLVVFIVLSFIVLVFVVLLVAPISNNFRNRVLNQNFPFHTAYHVGLHLKSHSFSTHDDDVIVKDVLSLGVSQHVH